MIELGKVYKEGSLYYQCTQLDPLDDKDYFFYLTCLNSTQDNNHWSGWRIDQSKVKLVEGQEAKLALLKAVK